MNLVCNYTDTFSGHQYLVNCVGNKETTLRTIDKGQYKDNFPMLLTYVCEKYVGILLTIFTNLTKRKYF